MQVVRGEDGSKKAKNVGNDLVKIAEVRIKASQTMLGEEDVRKVFALKDGDENIVEGNKNKNWTSQLNKTFYILPLKNNLERYFKIHNKDGSLKKGAITKDSIAFEGAEALNATLMSLGLQIALSSDKKTFEGSEILYLRLLPQTRVSEAILEAYKHIFFLWDAFITQGHDVYNASVKHIDSEIRTTTKAFTKQLEKEMMERITADDEEREERIRGDEANKVLAKNAQKRALPMGAVLRTFNKIVREGFLELAGQSFKKEEHQSFYEFWKKNLSIFGYDYKGDPLLPKIEKEDYSRMGELATFLGSGYHDEFLICDGSPFSPDVYKDFYESYWKPYLSYLGKDELTGWPLRPHLNSTIVGSNIYIKVLAHTKTEWTHFFIKAN